MLVLVAELVVIGGSLQLASSIGSSRDVLAAESFSVYPALLPAVAAVGISVRATQRHADLTGIPMAIRDLPSGLKWAAPAIAAAYISAAITALLLQLTGVALCGANA